MILFKNLITANRDFYFESRRLGCQGRLLMNCQKHQPPEEEASSCTYLPQHLHLVARDTRAPTTEWATISFPFSPATPFGICARNHGERFTWRDRVAAPRQNTKKEKGGNKCGAPHSRQQTVHHASAAEGKRNAAAARVLFSGQSEAAGIPALSPIVAAHITRKRLIYHVRSLITFHCKQAKDAFVSWCSVRRSRGGSATAEINKRFREKGVLFHISSTFSWHLCVRLVISTAVFIVSPRRAPPVITCHTCPVKDKMKLSFTVDVKQEVFPPRDAGGI